MHHLITFACSLLALAFSAIRSLANPIANAVDDHLFHIPTANESAILARRVLRHTPIGVFSTIYPAEANSRYHEPMHKLESTPVGLMEYIADCETSGNPTILAIGIATTFRNVASGSNVSLSLTWTPPYAPSSRISSMPNSYAYSAANLPRFSLFGYLEIIEGPDVEKLSVKDCFIKSHPDAKLWLPGNKIHASEWQRFVVQDVYWVGGFGNRAYIGWIPAGAWKNVTDEEIQKVRLPGEKKGWKEWSVENTSEDL